LPKYNTLTQTDDYYMTEEKAENRMPSRYGAWLAGFLLGCLGGAGPWMYVGVWDTTLLAGALAGGAAGLAAGMLWARRILINLNDDSATRGELIAAGTGWGAISAAGSVLVYWLVLAVIYPPAAELFLQAGYFALLAAIVIGGLIGLVTSLAWIRKALGPAETKGNTK
jgi:hypothetical protein